MEQVAQTEMTARDGSTFERALIEGGFTLFDVVRTRMFVTDMAFSDALSAVHGEVFRVGGGTVWLMQGWHSVGKAKSTQTWDAEKLGTALKAELAKGKTRKETMNDVFAEGL